MNGSRGRIGGLVRRGVQVALVMLIALASPSPAPADEIVQVAPHRAGLRPGGEGPPLLGYLARPTGAGPFPAVIVLHGCGGLLASDIGAAARLRLWGYVALVLDSLGHANTCRHAGGATAEAFDAYAGLEYLAGLHEVDRRRIAVLGFSMGGAAALEIVETGLMAQLWPGHFRAAVAYYPQCQYATGVMTVPTLILIGDRDDWASAPACRAMLARRAGKGAPVTLAVYPGATHAFNLHEPRRHYLGHLLAYDPAATHAARARMRGFLHAVLAAPSALPPGTQGRTVRDK